jgi:hypothetical protein
MLTLMMISSITVLIVPVLVGCTEPTTLVTTSSLRSQSHTYEAQYKSRRTQMGYIVDESSRDLFSFNQQLKSCLSNLGSTLLGYTTVKLSCLPGTTSSEGDSHAQRSPSGYPEQQSLYQGCFCCADVVTKAIVTTRSCKPPSQMLFLVATSGTTSLVTTSATTPFELSKISNKFRNKFPPLFISFGGNKYQSSPS